MEEEEGKEEEGEKNVNVSELRVFRSVILILFLPLFLLYPR